MEEMEKKKSVFVAKTSVPYESGWINGIFSTREKAEAVANRINAKRLARDPTDDILVYVTEIPLDEEVNTDGITVHI